MRQRSYCGRDGGNCQCTSVAECIHVSDTVSHEPDGFVTLHHGRRPLLDRVAWVFVLVLTVVVLWRL